jgi:hypothetical protein
LYGAIICYYEYYSLAEKIKKILLWLHALTIRDLMLGYAKDSRIYAFITQSSLSSPISEEITVTVPLYRVQRPPLLVLVVYTCELAQVTASTIAFTAIAIMKLTADTIALTSPP